ncbi:MAG: DNA polymerase III subunit beta [Fibrobacterota bacterium]
MQFSISKRDLNTLIQKVYPIVPTRTSLQVLTNIKLSINEGQITVFASDLDNFVYSSCPVKTRENAEIAVDARKFFEIVKEAGDEELLISIENNQLGLSNETGFNCTITGVSLREFPHFPETEFLSSFPISTAVLSSLVHKCSFAVSKDESRGCLCGILWEIFKNRTGMVATDGHRLGASFVDLDFEEEASLIVSQKSMIHVLKTAELTGAEEIQFSLHDKYIVFTLDGFTLSSKLIKGPYPDYEKGIPTEFSRSAYLQRGPLMESIRRVSTLSSNKSQLVKLVFTADTLTISTNNRDIGGFAQQNIPVSFSGAGEETFNIGFNSRYLQEILSVIEADEVKFNMNDEVMAVVITPEYGEEESRLLESDDLFLIMPLKIFE